MLSDEELLRYSRHILLEEIDVKGQQALARSRVVVVGLGGLGSPVAMYLAAAGVGHLHLIDFDDVDISNLQRQVIHHQTTVGLNKAHSAKCAIAQLNEHVEVECTTVRVAPSDWNALIAGYNVVVDCTDNFATRFAINAAAWKAAIPLVSGAAIRFEGQLSVFNANQADSPCYQCLYSPDIDDDLRCANTGVVSPLVGAIGSLQALEVIKLITHVGVPLVGRLSTFDALTHRWRELKITKDPQCAVCSR